MVENMCWADATYGLQQLYQQVHNGPGVAAIEPAIPPAQRLSAVLDESADRVADAMKAAAVGWQGQASTAASGSMQKLVGWAGEGGTSTGAAPTHVRGYSDSFAAFKAAVAKPVPVPSVTAWGNFLDHYTWMTSDHAAAVQQNQNLAARATDALARHQQQTQQGIGAIPELAALPPTTSDNTPLAQSPTQPNGNHPPGTGTPPGSTPPGTPAGTGAGGTGAGGTGAGGGSTGGAAAGDSASRGGSRNSGGDAGDTSTSGYTPPPPPTTAGPAGSGLGGPGVDSGLGGVGGGSGMDGSGGGSGLGGSGLGGSGNGGAGYVPPPLPAVPPEHGGYRPGSIARALEGTPARRAEGMVRDAAPTSALTEAERAATATRPGSPGMPMGAGAAGAGKGQDGEHRNNTYLPTDEAFRVDLDGLVTEPVIGLDGPSR